MRFQVVALIGLMSVGCAPAVKSAADATVTAAEDPKLQTRVADALGTPQSQKALSELSSGVTQGVVEGLSNEQMQARLDELVRHLTQAIFASIDQALTPEMQAKVSLLVSNVAAQAVQASGVAMVEMVKSPEMQATLQSTTRELARQAVLGSNDALTELQEKQKKEGGAGGPLGSATSFFAQRTWLVAALAVAAVLSLPLWWLLRERKRARRYKLDAERRHARAAAILTAMDMAGDGNLSPKVLSLVRDQLLEDALGAVGAPQTSLAPVAEPNDSSRGGGMRPSAA